MKKCWRICFMCTLRKVEVWTDESWSCWLLLWKIAGAFSPNCFVMWWRWFAEVILDLVARVPIWWFYLMFSVLILLACCDECLCVSDYVSESVPSCHIYLSPSSSALVSTTHPRFEHRGNYSEKWVPHFWFFKSIRLFWIDSFIWVISFNYLSNFV